MKLDDASKSGLAYERNGRPALPRGYEKADLRSTGKGGEDQTSPSSSPWYLDNLVIVPACGLVAGCAVALWTEGPFNWTLPSIGVFFGFIVTLAAKAVTHRKEQLK